MCFGFFIKTSHLHLICWVNRLWSDYAQIPYCIYLICVASTNVYTVVVFFGKKADSNYWTNSFWEFNNIVKIITHGRCSLYFRHCDLSCLVSYLKFRFLLRHQRTHFAYFKMNISVIIETCFPFCIQFNY